MSHKTHKTNEILEIMLQMKKATWKIEERESSIIILK